MKDEEAPTTTVPPTAWRKEGSDGAGGGGLLFSKGRYKFWALAAILLLAFWSMLTGTVTLKWSAGNLNPLSGDFDSPIHDDFDILEVEERKKFVRQMWDVYTHGSSIRLPRFWVEAFQAAYEDLTGEAPSVKDAAISEIARMSLRNVRLDSPTVQSTVADQSTRKGGNISKEAEKKMVTLDKTSQ